ASACASSSIRRISSFFASCADMPAICSRRRRSSPISFSRSTSRSATVFSRLEELEFSVEHGFSLGKTTLFAFDLRSTSADIELEILAELDQLFFAGDERALHEALRLTFGLADD